MIERLMEILCNNPFVTMLVLLPVLFQACVGVAYLLADALERYRNRGRFF